MSIDKIKEEARTFADGIKLETIISGSGPRRDAYQHVHNMRHAAEVDKFSRALTSLKGILKQGSLSIEDAWVPMIKRGEDIRNRWRKAERERLVAQPKTEYHYTDATVAFRNQAMREIEIFEQALQRLEMFVEIDALKPHDDYDDRPSGPWQPDDPIRGRLQDLNRRSDISLRSVLNINYGDAPTRRVVEDKL